MAKETAKAKVARLVKEAKAAKAKPTETPKSEYDRIAERITAAIGELNASLDAAAELPDQMRVEISRVGKTQPGSFTYQIFRASHFSLAYAIEVKPADESKLPPGWKPHAPTQPAAE